MAHRGARLAQMLERMPEDNGRPLSGPLVEIHDLRFPHVQAGVRCLGSLLEADRNPPSGYQRLQ
jgi:hypothetical protein